MYILICLFIQEIWKKEEFFTFDVYSIFLFFLNRLLNIASNKFLLFDQTLINPQSQIQNHEGYTR